MFIYKHVSEFSKKKKKLHPVLIIPFVYVTINEDLTKWNP